MRKTRAGCRCLLLAVCLSLLSLSALGERNRRRLPVHHAGLGRSGRHAARRANVCGRRVHLRRQPASTASFPWTTRAQTATAGDAGRCRHRSRAALAVFQSLRSAEARTSPTTKSASACTPPTATNPTCPTDGDSSLWQGAGIYDVGNALKDELEELGVEVDLLGGDPSSRTTRARTTARRSTAEELLKKGPDALLDIHRDAHSRRANTKPRSTARTMSKVRLFVGRSNQNSAANKAFAQQIKKPGRQGVSRPHQGHLYRQGQLQSGAAIRRRCCWNSAPHEIEKDKAHRRDRLHGRRCSTRRSTAQRPRPPAARRTAPAVDGNRLGRSVWPCWPRWCTP